MSAERPSYREEMEAAVEIVTRACKMARALQRRWCAGRTDGGNAAAVAKEDASPVTVADFAVQSLVLGELHALFPDDVFIAEEKSANLPQTALEAEVRRWVQQYERQPVSTGVRAAIDLGGYAGGHGGRTGVAGTRSGAAGRAGLPEPAFSARGATDRLAVCDEFRGRKVSDHLERRRRLYVLCNPRRRSVHATGGGRRGHAAARAATSAREPEHRSVVGDAVGVGGAGALVARYHRSRGQHSGRATATGRRQPVQVRHDGTRGGVHLPAFSSHRLRGEHLGSCRRVRGAAGSRRHGERCVRSGSGFRARPQAVERARHRGHQRATASSGAGGGATCAGRGGERTAAAAAAAAGGGGGAHGQGAVIVVRNAYGRQGQVEEVPPDAAASYRPLSSSHSNATLARALCTTSSARVPGRVITLTLTRFSDGCGTL
eukprot:ctg_390.g204